MSILKKAHEITKNTVAFFAARKEKIPYQATFISILKELKMNPDFMPVYTDISTLSREEKKQLLMKNFPDALPEIVYLTVRESGGGRWFHLLNAYNKRNKDREMSYHMLAYYKERDAACAAAIIKHEAETILYNALLENGLPRLEYKKEASFEKKGKYWFVRAPGKQAGDTVIVITSTCKTKRVVLGAKVERSKDLFHIFSFETIKNRIIVKKPDLTNVKPEVKKIALELIKDDIKRLELKFDCNSNMTEEDWAELY
jgi:hypothetical protein